MQKPISRNELEQITKRDALRDKLGQAIKDKRPLSEIEALKRAYAEARDACEPVREKLIKPL